MRGQEKDCMKYINYKMRIAIPAWYTVGRHNICHEFSLGIKTAIKNTARSDTQHQREEVTFSAAQVQAISFSS